MPRIKGTRIQLREYEQSDLPYIRNWVNNGEIVSTLSDVFLYPHSQSQSEQFLKRMMEGSEQSYKGFVIAQKDSGEYIGQIDLFKLDWKNRSAEIGIVISPDYLGQGYGSEAIKLLQDFSFLQLNLHRLELRVYDFNERALRCYSSCGFKEEGRQRQNHFSNGQYSDTILMSILKEEYEVIRELEAAE